MLWTRALRTRTTGSLAIGLVALVVGLAAGFLSWFQISGSGYPLVSDSYNAVYVYASQGGSALSSLNSLGNLLASSAASNAGVVVAFALVLFFWPAMLVAGLINEVGKTVRWQPAL